MPVVRNHGHHLYGLLVYSNQEDFEFLREKMDDRFRPEIGDLCNTYNEDDKLDYLSMEFAIIAMDQ